MYFSDLGTRTTIGLDVRTGRVVFSFPDGAFNPVIADYGAIYLSGYSMMYQMLPEAPHTAHAAAKRPPMCAASRISVRPANPAKTPANKAAGNSAFGRSLLSLGVYALS